MLHLDERGRPTNWEESQSYLETNGFLDRVVFEQELATWHQDARYTFKNAEIAFTNMIARHVGNRIEARIPTHGGYTNFSASDDRLRSKLYVGSALDGGKHWENYCAAPDWLTALYWQEADQKRGVKWKYPVGTFLYSASANKVYVVYETNSISSSEAADLEEGWDAFDTEGDYSLLRLPLTEEEKVQAQRTYEAQQGIIGGLEPNGRQETRWISLYPTLLLPGEGSPYVFDYHGTHEAKPKRPGNGWPIEGKLDEDRAIVTKKAQAFLLERYPTLRFVEWPDFQRLEKHRID